MSKLPTWEECERKPREDRNALEDFIHDNEPAGVPGDEEFRLGLECALNWWASQSEKGAKPPSAHDEYARDIKALLEAFVTSQAALRVALHYINTERNKANVYSIEFVNESIRMALGSQYDAEGKPSPQRGADLIEGKS